MAVTCDFMYVMGLEIYFVCFFFYLFVLETGSYYQTYDSLKSASLPSQHSDS